MTRYIATLMLVGCASQSPKAKQAQAPPERTLTLTLAVLPKPECPEGREAYPIPPGLWLCIETPLARNDQTVTMSILQEICPNGTIRKGELAGAKEAAWKSVVEMVRWKAVGVEVKPVPYSWITTVPFEEGKLRLYCEVESPLLPASQAAP